MKKKGKYERKGKAEWRKYEKMNQRYKDIGSFVTHNRKLLYCHSDIYVGGYGHSNIHVGVGGPRTPHLP